MRPAFLALALLFLALQACAENVTGFEDLSLTVTITAKEDGTAHVTEEVRLAVSQNVVDLYKTSLLSTRLTIVDWQRTTGSRNLRHHVLGENVTPLNTRVFPRPLTRLYFSERAIAIITVEYDTSGRVFDLTEIGPRRTAYTLLPGVLSFENAPEGQVLPENTVLEINVLPNSVVDLHSTFPRPTSPEFEDRPATARSYVWNATGGAIPITPFDFTFVTEKSLDEEVSEFFADMQRQAASMLLSNYGLLIIILVLIFLALIAILRQTKTI